MQIYHNLAALLSYNKVSALGSNMSKAIQKLSTGLRINSAADDAAGLAISEKMASQVRGLDQARRNAQDGISLLQTAEGALQSVHSMLQRMRELAVQAANDVLTSQDRAYIQAEIEELTNQVNAVAKQTQFNKKKILDGSSAILWSTSTSDIKVIVAGTLLTKDHFGTVNNAEGNYKITFNALHTGMEQVQKSNILTLKHGTVDDRIEFAEGTGVQSVSSLNLVEGIWGLEARGEAFGGVRYYHGSNEYATTTLGMTGVGEQVNASADGKLADGTYEVRLSEKLPMMASFDESVVNNVNMSNRNASADFDAELRVDESAGAANSSTNVYRDDTGGQAADIASITTKADADINVFTRYEITSQNQLDTLTGAVSIYTDYLSTVGPVTATLDYQTAPTPDPAEIGVNLSYVSAGGTMLIQSTFHFGVGQFMTFHNDDTSGYLVNYADGLGTADDFTIDLSGLTMSDASIAIWQAMRNRNWDGGLDGSGYHGVRTFGLSVDTGNSSSAMLLRAQGGSTITISGTAANTIQINGSHSSPSNTALDSSYYSESFDVDRQIQLDIASGVSLTTIASNLSHAGGRLIVSGVDAGPLNDIFGARGVLVGVTNVGGVGHLEFTQDGGPVQYDIRIVNGGTTVTELGLLNKSMTHVVGQTIASDNVYDGYTLPTSISIGATSSIDDVANALDAGLILANPLLAGGNVTIDTNNTVATGIPNAVINLSQLRATNNSMYMITLYDISGNVLSELNNGDVTLNRNATTYGVNVFNGTTVTVNLAGGETVSQIEAALSAAVTGIMGQDGRIGNIGADFFTYDTANETITVRSQDVYKIDIAGAAVTSLWGGASVFVNRGSVGGVTSDAAASRSLVMGPVSLEGLTIEAAYALLDTSLLAASITDLALAWTINMNPTTGVEGQLSLTNSSSAPTLTRYIIVQDSVIPGADKSALFASNQIIVDPTQAAISNIIQAKDNMVVRIDAVGNRADNGNSVTGSRTATLWKGADAGTIAQNVTSLNAATGSLLGSNFYTGTFDATNLDVGDSWILYTNAQGIANSDSVTIDLYDGKYTATGAAGGNNGGVSTNITYYFNDNVLNNSAIGINQMIRSSASGFETLTHNIGFGATLTDTVIQYGERKDAGNATEWALGSGVNAWYGQAYYGGDTTYFFANPLANATNVVTNAKVAKQNEINATLMFRYLGGNQFEVQMKGYDRYGAALSGTNTVNASTQTALIYDMNTKFGIDFTTLAIDTGNLTVNDKFVINVAAAAMFDGSPNSNPATAAGFVSGDNIAIKGDPLSQNSTGSWGTTAQYRFNDGGSSKSLDLLGFIIDPLLGADNNDGVGWYSGQLELRDDTTSTGAQFAANSGVGEVGFRGTSGTDPNLAYWVRVEVIDGQARSLSKSNVTSVYMQKLENRSDLSLGDFIKKIHYSNYLYDKEVPLDGKQKVGATYTVYNPYNAEVIFDVMEVSNHFLKLRAQAHIVDLDGVYRYAEDEEIYLNDGENANNTVLRLFAGNGFDGLLFDEFTLGDYSNWTVGDRFTLSLTASGEESPDINEITLQSDQRGTNNPHSWRFRDGVLENTKTDLHMYQLVHNLFKPDSDHFSSDQVMDGTVTIGIGSSIVKPLKIDPDTGSAIPYDPLTDWKTGFPTSASVIFQTLLKRGIDAGIAHYYSKAEDIAQFWDGNGKFIMDSGSQIMTVVRGNDEFNIAIGSRLEMGYLARMISEQIYDKLLSDNPVREEDKYRIFRLVNTVPGNNPLESVVGTFLSHSVIPGTEDAIRFFGSEDLMKAFAFATIQKAEDDMFWINVSDAHTGHFVTSTKVSAGGVSYGFISPQINVSLDISGDIGLKQVRYSDWAGSFTTKLQESFSHYVHLADNASHLQIGANEGENMMLVLGDMSANALGIDSLELRDRALAARAITQIDNAIDKVSTQRARIGSSINRLDHTIENLTASSTNLVAAQSRIRDTDYAKVMMQFVKYQILIQSGTSMLGQANQLGSNVLQLLSM